VPQIALLNEHELIARLSTGDEGAFTAIYNFYSDTVFNTAMIYTKDETESQEIVQQIFIKVWERRNQLADVRSLQKWLFTSTRNKVFDHLRKVSQIRRTLNGFRDQQDNQHGPNGPGPDADSTSQWLQQKEYGQLLDKAVSGLTRQQKLVYTLAEERALNFDEIAGELNLSKSTVKKHMELARKNVRHYISSHVHPDLLPVLLALLSADTASWFH
jgi:RNA polymerase sigma-70 factor (family 1)